jgi:hypothetical protein
MLRGHLPKPPRVLLLHRLPVSGRLRARIRVRGPR